MSIASQKRLVSQNRRALLGRRARPRLGKVARFPSANPMHSKELHHFCTVSSPIFASLGKPTVDYQPLTKKIAPRRSVPIVRVSLVFHQASEFCTVSAPFLHRFSHDLGNHPLIINHFQKKLHRDMLSHPCAASGPAQLPLRLVYLLSVARASSPASSSGVSPRE